VAAVNGSPALASPDELVSQARMRLDDELRAVPPWPSAELFLRLRSVDPAVGVSYGMLAHFIRRAWRDSMASIAHELFSVLCSRISGLTQRWARRAALGATGEHSVAHADICEDLCQELVLHLWEQIALGTSVAWELFFTRSLDFAQRHIATAYMRRHGYWAGSTRSVSSLPLARLGALLEQMETASVIEPEASFAASELADLRALVSELPVRERVVIIMRYWQGATEEEMAVAIGGVTTRTVRNYLRKAHARLRARYLEAEVAR